MEFIRLCKGKQSWYWIAVIYTLKIHRFFSTCNNSWRVKEIIFDWISILVQNYFGKFI